MKIGGVDAIVILDFLGSLLVCMGLSEFIAFPLKTQIGASEKSVEDKVEGNHGCSWAWRKPNAMVLWGQAQDGGTP